MGMMGFGYGFDLFQIMFFIMFFLVMSVFVISIGKSVLQWNKNNHSPRLTVPATIVAKRTHVNRRHSHGGANSIHRHTSTSTTYYVTFQVESGDRMELQMAGTDYGLLIEGDRGRLTFQGTRYLSFERT